jgi:predicted nucleic acid-binding protein
MLLVDTNILLDVLTDDSDWAEWSIKALENYESKGLAINPAIYAELSYGFSSSEEVDAMIRQFGLTYMETSRDGLFRASQAFRRYKQQGGGRNFVLPEFFLGGHAESVSCPVLTRDVKMYNSYFSSVPLICP